MISLTAPILELQAIYDSDAKAIFCRDFGSEINIDDIWYPQNATDNKAYTKYINWYRDFFVHNKDLFVRKYTTKALLF